MAAIRFVDAWLRCPGAPPSQYRSVMVIAEKWAEQRVLMRAYAESRDQTRPTILLHGTELALGPAGLDVNGPWGIHVADQAAAHAIKYGLEEAARRIAGSKGNPPRLLDEAQTFDREPTGNWTQGAPRILPQRVDPRGPMVDHVAPTPAARIPQAQVATILPQMAGSGHHGAVTPPVNPELRKTPVPRVRGSRTRPPPLGMRTALGYSSGAGAQSAIVRLGLAPHVSAKLGRYNDRVVPADFAIDVGERRVLNALGEYEHMSARAIGQMLDLADAVSFMEELVRKLEAFGLGDLVEPGNPVGGEPTYRMRR
jgi:hypothetical protein